MLLTRRLVSGGVLSLLAVGAQSSAFADMSDMTAAIRSAIGQRTLREGRIKLDIPALVENGNSVPLGIAVDSPMTAEDYVTDIYVFSPENPLPFISRFRLGARSGKAEVKTTIRLATTQHVHVIALMNDGSAYVVTEEVEVTTAACFDPT